MILLAIYYFLITKSNFIYTFIAIPLVGINMLTGGILELKKNSKSILRYYNIILGLILILLFIPIFIDMVQI